MPDHDALLTLAVLLAAFTHASWHALLKAQGEMLQTIAAVYGLASVVCAAGVALVPFPGPEAIALVAVSVALHCASYVYIARAYEVSDLSHAFPLYRGLAPVLVAVAAWPVAGERPGALGTVGLLLAAGGVASLAFERGLRLRDASPAVRQLALSAALVAAYTVVDGLGVRRSQTPASYIVWLFLLNGPAAMALAWLARRRRGSQATRIAAARLAAASLLALLSHGLVIGAMSVGKLATVAALRETAVVFAAIIGATVLGEPFGRYRIAASVCVAAGVILLHVAG